MRHIVIAVALTGWAPTTPLAVGLEQTYRWIYDQMVAERQPLKDAVAAV